MNVVLNRLSLKLARYLAAPRHVHDASAPVDLSRLRACLQPADVLLVEGHSRFSSGIKYLTQSTWSHAALYVGSTLTGAASGAEGDSAQGVVPYPILPIIEHRPANDPACPACTEERLHIRHHSLFVPKDFDVSPYFEVIKPTLAQSFDHHALHWSRPM